MTKVDRFVFTAWLAVACVLAGCRKAAAPAGGGKGARGAAVPVLVATAVSRDVPVEVRAIGNVQPFSSVTIRARISGELLKVHFKEGDDVKAGDLLFTIDPRQAEASLRQSQANLKRDEAQLESARLEFDRVKKLTESGISSPDEFDKARTAFQALEGTVLADRAAISNATLSLEFTQIRSPLDGRTGNLMIKEGNIVKAEDDRLVTINQVHPIYVAFAVPEQELPQIRARMAKSALPVAVSLPDRTNTLSSVELSFIDNAVDATTGTILLKATFANRDNALWPGQFLQVRLTVNTLNNATIVPSQAVQSSQSGEFVFVVQPDMTVEKRNIRLGISRSGFVVIDEGVKPGEVVVTDGQMRLGPKSRVALPEAAGGARPPVAGPRTNTVENRQQG